MGISVPNFLCQLPWQEVQNPEGLPYHGGSLSPCPEGLHESWGGQPTAGGCPSSSWVWGLLDVPRAGWGGGCSSSRLCPTTMVLEGCGGDTAVPGRSPPR